MLKVIYALCLPGTGQHITGGIANEDVVFCPDTLYIEHSPCAKEREGYTVNHSLPGTGQHIVGGCATAYHIITFHDFNYLLLFIKELLKIE